MSLPAFPVGTYSCWWLPCSSPFITIVIVGLQYLIGPNPGGTGTLPSPLLPLRIITLVIVICPRCPSITLFFVGLFVEPWLDGTRTPPPLHCPRVITDPRTEFPAATHYPIDLARTTIYSLLWLTLPGLDIYLIVFIGPQFGHDLVDIIYCYYYLQLIYSQFTPVKLLFCLLLLFGDVIDC